MYKDEWGPEKKKAVQVDQDIEMMRVSDIKQMDERDRALREFVEDFRLTEVARSDVRTEVEKKMSEVAVDDFDPEAMEAGVAEFMVTDCGLETPVSVGVNQGG